MIEQYQVKWSVTTVEKNSYHSINMTQLRTCRLRDLSRTSMKYAH